MPLKSNDTRSINSRLVWCLSRTTILVLILLLPSERAYEGASDRGRQTGKDKLLCRLFRTIKKVYSMLSLQTCLKIKIKTVSYRFLDILWSSLSSNESFTKKILLTDIALFLWPKSKLFLESFVLGCIVSGGRGKLVPLLSDWNSKFVGYGRIYFVSGSTKTEYIQTLFCRIL